MKLNYKLYGNGKETVLFLHGWGANLNSFNFFCNQLSQNFKILQVDFSGHGQSEKLTCPFFVFDYTAEIFKLLKMLNISEVNIVAHSFGARVVIMLCKYFNVQINKLVIIGGAGIKPKFNILNKIKIYNYKLKKHLNKFKVFNFDLSKYGSSDYKSLNNIEKQSFVNIVNYNQVEQLKFIRANTLLIWGDKDQSTPLYMAKIFNKKIKNSSLKIIKNANHFCFLTHSNYVLFYINSFL